MTTKLEDSNAAPKNCWVILNRLLCNKTSLLYHLYLLMVVLFQATANSGYCKKANLFNNSFVSICTPIQNNSVLPLVRPTPE